MQVFLKVATGSHAGKEIAIASEKFLIGRSSECQLRPKSESVSRRHCVVVVRDGRLLAQDLKSRNGTYVNEKKLPPDKAKVLNAGDVLRVGKLSFEVVIKVPVGGAKKPQVKDVADAADRTVKAASDSKFEEVDISSWLDEADQIDRVRKTGDPDTRQLRLDDTREGTEDSSELSVDTTPSDDGEEELDPAEQRKRELMEQRKQKSAPGKLPKLPPGSSSGDSREAADAALKKFFGGR
jgi:pSer/pThr/pTyr-binding forkhead associated (FHA) protein